MNTDPEHTPKPESLPVDDPQIPPSATNSIPSTTDATPAQPTNSTIQWLSKEEYEAKQAAPINAKPAYVVAPKAELFWKISGGILVGLFALYLLTALTPIGHIIDSHDIDHHTQQVIHAYPIPNLLLFMVIPAFFVFTASVIVRQYATKRHTWSGIMMLVLGLLAVVNPISAFILLYLLFCGFQPCQSVSS